MNTNNYNNNNSNNNNDNNNKIIVIIIIIIIIKYLNKLIKLTQISKDKHYRKMTK